MNTCSIFGHRMVLEEIEDVLKQALEDLIINHGITMFYVGNNGDFDVIARKVLKTLKKKHPCIDYAVVLAYLPGKQPEFHKKDFSDTIYPEALEQTPFRFAIPKRNRWMVNQADFVLVYVKHATGGAAQAAELARKKGKPVWNLAEK